MVARATLNEPRMWTAMTASHSASVILWNITSRRMPAGLITGVQTAEFLLGLLDHAVDGVEVGDAVGVGNRFAARGADLLRRPASAGPAEPSSPPVRPPPRSLTTTFAPS